MTKEQYEMADTMLESGCSYAQVARNLQLSRQTVSRYFNHKYHRAAPAAGAIKSCEASRELAIWMKENEISIRMLAHFCYVSDGTICRLLYMGKASATTLAAVSKVTGLPADKLIQK